MNPTSKETPNGPLPSSAEQTSSSLSESAIKTVPFGAEQAVPTAEKALVSPAPGGSSASVPVTIPLPLPVPSMTAANDASTTTLSVASQADDDNDLIEKEWVNKAKQIVERNRDDPYRQSEELTVFKADYMKKRYGKTIKVSQ